MYERFFVIKYGNSIFFELSVWVNSHGRYVNDIQLFVEGYYFSELSIHRLSKNTDILPVYQLPELFHEFDGRLFFDGLSLFPVNSIDFEELKNRIELLKESGLSDEY